MRSQKFSLKMRLLFTVLSLFTISLSGFAQQSFSLSVTNCSAAAQDLSFDVTVTNLLTTDLRFNAATLRFQFGANILPSTGTNTVSWGYAGESDFPSSFPNVFPAAGNPTFSYNAATRTCSVNTATAAYNNLTCTAPLIAGGETKKIGRFVIHNSQPFVTDQQVGLTWVTTSGLTLYSACTSTTVGYQLTTNRTLNPPCNLSTLPSCTNTSSSASATACDSYTWSANGTTYTTSGVYTYVTTLAGGCTDTKTLNLTITPSSVHSTTISACDSYTWSNNGQTYSASGTYSGTTTNCVTEQLVLTITPSSNHTTNASACGSYTWSNNGQTYTTSGVYTGTTTNCVTEKLNLTITPATSNTTTASACGTYHWGVNDADYTASGTYTSVRNCHTEILELTITPSTTNTTEANACGSYTWSNNGQTYTTSGIYTGTTTNCVTELLDLTVTPNTTNTTTATACGSYTWSVNNSTYTASGTYSVVSGCHTEVLDLTINPATITTQPAANFICSTVGSTSSFSVETNVLSPSYTWQYRVVTAANPNPVWNTITSAQAAVYSGYATATLHVTKATTTLPATGTQYRVLVSGACGDVASNSASLMIISTVKAGTITSPTATVCLGSDITLTLGGYAATSFQWQSSPISTTAAPGVFTDIPGATGTSYTIVGATSTMDKSYRVVVTNSCNNTTATSLVKTLKVDPTSVAGNIVSGGGVVCLGSGSTLKVAGHVGTVQWEYSTDGGVTYVNAPAASAGQTVPFGTTSVNSKSATYIITGISTELYFRAKLTSGTCSSAYTAPAHYTLGTQAEVGTVTAASTLLCPASGTTLTLSSAVGIVTWQKATNITAPVWTSTTNHTMSLATGNLTASAAYRALVTIGTCSTVSSNIVVVAVVAKPVVKTLTTNTTTPAGAAAATAICTNSTVAKILTAGVGTTGGTIQWQWSTTSATAGFVDIAGETGTSYTITNPSVGANYYRIVVTNSCGVSVTGTAKAVWYKDCGPAKFAPVAVASPFSVVAYPNPYSENFNLSLTTSSVDTVGVSIYDMTGKLIDRRELSPSEVSGLQIGNRYASGVYNVVVTQGSDVKTLRVIKR